MKHFSIFILVVLTEGCSHSTAPLPMKSPREYTWTIDTLSNPSTFQRSMISIWASNAQDVYVAGFTDGARGKMYHYDGSAWTSVELHVLEGGPFPNIRQFGAMFGFSSRDIFAVGSKIGPSFEDSSFIIHFDGTGWSEQPAYGASYLQAVWGSSPVDVWAGGTHGSLFHYDGSAWEKYPMPDSIWFASIAGKSSNEGYAIAYAIGEFGLNTYYCLTWNGDQWHVQEWFKESISEEDKFGSNNVILLDGVLFSVGSGVYEKSQAGWQRIYGGRFTGFRDLCGSDKNSFFAVGNYGLIVNYNGVDWKPMAPVNTVDIHYGSCWTDGREVFIVGNDGTKSYVLHGK